MTTLLLARHGRSTSNAAGTLAGRTPGIELDEIGRGQAMRLGERLRGINLAAVVCSPIQRCRETTELALASAGIDVPVHIDDRVVETDYGDWSGRALKDLFREPAWRTVQASPSSMVFPGGEALAAVQQRMLAAVEHWNAQLDSDAVWLCVSHGDPIALTLSALLGQPMDDFQRIATDPASVSVVVFPPKPEAQAASSASEQETPGAPVDPPSPFPRVATMNSIAGQLREFIPSSPNAGPEVGGGLGAAGGGTPGNGLG